jgi:dolichol-phosphate mannosyltransferase
MLPAYNEALSLPSLLQRIENVKINFDLKTLEVVVVNDGSKDNTPEIAKNFVGNVTVDLLDLQPNRGLAGAMREGFRYCLNKLNDDDILITMDGDDSHNPGLVFRMISQIREGSDIVIASRYQYGARIIGLAWYRELFSEFAGYLFRIFRPIKGVKDFTCGYRAYRVSFLKKVMNHYGENFIQQKGFACMAEILLKTKPFNPIIHELPFILRYDQKMGDSKMNVFKTIKQTLNMIFFNK